MCFNGCMLKGPWRQEKRTFELHIEWSMKVRQHGREERALHTEGRVYRAQRHSRARWPGDQKELDVADVWTK